MAGSRRFKSPWPEFFLQYARLELCGNVRNRTLIHQRHYPPFWFREKSLSSRQLRRATQWNETCTYPMNVAASGMRVCDGLSGSRLAGIHPAEAADEVIKMTVRTIVCPVDFSELSRLSFAYARELASGFGGKLVLVHVNVMPDVYSTGYAGFIPLPPYEKKPDPRLEQWQAEAVKNGVSADSVHLVGIPEHSIVSFAKQIGADLIVLGTHGHHGVTKFLMGSVTDYVMRHAHCEVIVVRGRHLAERPAEEGEQVGAASP